MFESIRKKASSPIRKNIIANFFGVGVNLLNQIALVPLFIYFWGNNLYADWLVLSAITVIFSMSDIGLNTVIQNRFSIKLASKEHTECNALLTNNILIVSFIFILSMIIIGCIIFCSNLVYLFGLHSITNSEAVCILVLIVIRVYLGMFSGIENAIYRATHNNSRCVFIDQLSLFTTVILTALCLYMGWGIIILCILLCCPPLIVIAFKYIDCKKFFNYRFSLKSNDKRLLVGLIKPSIAFMAFPIGNAILLQGYTFCVNFYYGASDVVEYNTTRTMCNFMIVLLGTINNSIWPEYSIAYGENDFKRMRALHSKSFSLSWVFSILCSLFIFAFGPFIFRIWTHGMVIFSYPLMSVFILAILLKVTWTASGITLMATNNHQKLGLIYMIGCIVSLGIGLSLCILSAPLYFMASSIILAHIITAFYTIKAGIELTKDNIKDFHVRNINFLLRKG